MSAAWMRALEFTSESGFLARRRRSGSSTSIEDSLRRLADAVVSTVSLSLLSLSTGRYAGLRFRLFFEGDDLVASDSLGDVALPRALWFEVERLAASRLRAAGRAVDVIVVEDEVEGVAVVVLG